MAAAMLRSGYTGATAISPSASPLAVVPDAILVNATATFTMTLNGTSVTVTSIAPGILEVSPTHVTAVGAGSITALFFPR